MTEQQQANYEFLRDAGLFFHRTEEALDRDVAWEIENGFHEGKTFEEARAASQFDLNLNDLFYYACSDEETVPLDQLAEVRRLYERHGFDGVSYWAWKARGMTLDEIQISKTRDAVKAVADAYAA